jgi:hypothetical protein
MAMNIRFLTEPAIWVNREKLDSSTAIGNDEKESTASIYIAMAGERRSASDVEEGERARLGIDGKGRNAPLANLVDGIEDPAVRVQSEPTRLRRFR